MMSEAKHETRAVFAGALVLTTPEKRARYLDDACRGNPDLRQRVEALLRAHEEAGAFLEEPAASLAGKTIAVATPPLSRRSRQRPQQPVREVD